MLDQDKKSDEKNEKNEKNENCESPDEDVLTSIVGEFGRFQLFNLFLMGLSTIMVGSNNFVTKFLAHEVDYWCTKVNLLLTTIMQVGNKLWEDLCLIAHNM